MKKYNKLIILSSVLFVIIVFLTLVMVFDFNALLFKNLSIAGIANEKEQVESLIQDKKNEDASYNSTLQELKNSENSYDVQKEAYENIPSSDIAIVQQATIDEKYFIEYLWVVLGNYAASNNLKIDIITPGSSYSTSTEASDSEVPNNTELADGNKSNNNTTVTTSGLKDRVKIVVKGRYSDLADFVFDVENDSSLRFKLDNIKMTYSGDNKVEATFDVLSLSVLN